MDNNTNKYKPFMGDMAALTALGSMFSIFDFAGDNEPTADPDYMANLRSQLTELNMTIAGLLCGIEKGISTKKVLDVNIDRIRNLASDIALTHKVHDEIQRYSESPDPEETASDPEEEPNIQNQTSNIQN
jgi:hypothetical protein